MKKYERKANSDANKDSEVPVRKIISSQTKPERAILVKSRRIIFYLSTIFLILSILLNWIPGITSIVVGFISLALGISLATCIISEILLKAGFEIERQFKIGEEYEREFDFVFSIPRLSLLVKLVVVSLSALIFGFSNIYASISYFDINSFSQKIGGVSSIYYSIVTFSTVGYGEIHPNSDLARLLVSLQIFVSFFIVVFVIASSISWVIMNERNSHEKYIKKRQAEVDYKEAIFKKLKTGVYRDKAMHDSPRDLSSEDEK